MAEEGVFNALPEQQDTLATYTQNLILRTDVRLSTKRHYLILLKKYALPKLGNKKLSTIKKQDIRQLLAELQSEGASLSTLSHLKTALGYLFRQAVDDEVIPTNPTHNIKTKVPKPDPTYTLDPKDFHKVLKKLPTDGAKLFARFLIGSGCRYGEATELRVKDINFNSKEVYIVRTVSDVGRKLNNGERFQVVSATKNGHKRTVVLSAALIAELRAFVTAKALSKEELIFSKHLVLEEDKLGSPSESQKPYTKGSKTFSHATAYSYNVGGCRCSQCKEAVKDYRNQYRKDKAKAKVESHSRSHSRSLTKSQSHSKSNDYLPRDRWRATWNKAIEQSGIGWYPKTHDLRHANATLLLTKGVDVNEVKERLGHQSITTTERYLHRIRHQQSKAAEVANDYLE
jgi:integrase